MRYRYSLWDPVVLMLAVLQAYGAWWVVQNAGPEIPLHWGPSGVPDRYGPPDLVSLLTPAAFGLTFYVAFRLLDGWVAVRQSMSYGFVTDFAGGFALLLAALQGMESMAVMAKSDLWFSPFALFGFFYAHTGLLFLRWENLPMNTAGLVADTPAAREMVRVTMGKGFVMSGLLAAGLGLLPGAWSMAALAPFLLGPLVAIVVAIARAPRR